MTQEPLEARVRGAGYTPRAREVGPILDLLAAGDDDLEKPALRALLRAGKPALDAALARFDTAVPPARSRLCELVGKFANDGAALFHWLVARLSDDDPKTRRRAISALGRLAPGEPEAPLLAALASARGLPDTRALAFSLGNVGGAAARAALAALPPGDPELARLVDEALRKIDARSLRAGGGEVELGAAPPAPLPVLLHVRAGLESVLLGELGDPSARASGRGRVTATLAGPLASLFRARTFLHLGFPLQPEPRGDDAAAAVVRALTGLPAWSIFQAFTRGAIRYRLEWNDRGRTRGQTAQVARAVSEARPELHNDSRDAPWQVVVTERRDRVYVELWPRVRDPRFLYRKRTLPASSHPTIAAALARVGGVRPDDVVWDPFAGSGMELCERALAGPYAALHGTDLSADAIAAARENLQEAGVNDARLEVGDVRQVQPPRGLSLVITNPPFGRRVLERDAVAPLLRSVLAVSARSFVAGGRFVWISPFGDETAEAAKANGFRVVLRAAVDVGGAPGELQCFSIE